MSQFQRWNAPSVTERIVRVCVNHRPYTKTIQQQQHHYYTVMKKQVWKKIKPRREREKEKEERKRELMLWILSFHGCNHFVDLACVSVWAEPSRVAPSRALCRTRKNAKGGDKKSPLYNSAHGPRMTELKSKKMALLEEEEEEELRCLASFSYFLILFGQ